MYFRKEIGNNFHVVYTTLDLNFDINLIILGRPFRISELYALRQSTAY